MTSAQDAALAQARLAYQLGWCVIPPREDGSKQPLPTTWTAYQEARPSPDELRAWYAVGRTGVGALMGKVSGNVELLDFDGEASFAAFKEAAEAMGLGELLGRIEHGYSESTPKPGVHLYYYCDATGRSTKLAQRPGAPDEHGKPTVETLIETKANGGYAVMAPSNGRVHPSGGVYSVRYGSLRTVATITPEERAALLDLARSFDELPRDEYTPPPDASPATGNRPGDEYNARATWDEVLTPWGWRRLFTSSAGVTYWRRPGKDRGWSATTNHGGHDCLYVFSTSTPFEAKRGYRKFSAYAILEHRGDFKAAAKALAEQGYGAPPRGHGTQGGTAAPTAQPSAPEGKPAQAPAADVGWVKRLADAILEADHFARDAGGKLYVYRAGAYRQRGEEHIGRRVKALLEEWGESKHWSTRRAEEVAAYIGLDAPELWERPPAHIVNVKNGLLDTRTGELAEHSPAFLSPVQLPVDFDPDADCPEWERFVAATFPADAQDLAWEVPADLLTPDRSEQKAILLLGEGGNGKSTYLAALVAFIGAQNRATLSLHTLEANRYAVARLVGKLANVCPDLPSTHLAETSMFKAIVGGDPIPAEYKHGALFDFAPYCRLVFSANHPPRSSDASYAFFRRWLVVPFERTFGAGDAIPRAELDAQLADPRELSGVLNRALAVLPRVRRQGFTESPSMRAAWDEFRETTDPLAVWLDQHTVDGPEAMVPKLTLQRAYNDACNAASRPVLSRKALGQALKRLRPNVVEAQRTIAGQVQWVWLGLGLRAEPSPEPDSASRVSLDSRDSLNCRHRESEEGEEGEREEVSTDRGNPVKPVKPVNDETGLPADCIARGVCGTSGRCPRGQHGEPCVPKGGER